MPRKDADVSLYEVEKAISAADDCIDALMNYNQQLQRALSELGVAWRDEKFNKVSEAVNEVGRVIEQEASKLNDVHTALCRVHSDMLETT